MENIKTLLITVCLTLPFLFADLYTKYLAHQELTNQDEQVTVIKPIYATSPIRNYGSFWFGGETDRKKAHHWAHLAFIPIIVMCFFSAYWIREIHYNMLLGGVLGNGIEIALFDGATDFLVAETGYWLLDQWIFNLADVFIYTGVLVIFLWIALTFVFFILQGVFRVVLIQLGIVEQYYRPAKKYSDELTREVADLYKSGKSLDEISLVTGKSTNSIRGKLVSEGIYSEFRDINYRLSQMHNQEVADLNLKVGWHYPFESLIDYLNNAGYIRVSRVNEEGFFEVKGGIVTLHPFGEQEPVKLDYFGDQLETIKTAITGKPLDSVCIRPFTVRAF